jgi:hypothetical protein
MKLLSTLRPFLTGAQLVAYVLVLVRIYSAGLHQTYRWFTIYMLYETVRLVVMGFLIPLATKLYGYIYFFTQPVTWCLYVLVILELYQLALRNKTGIATFARRTFVIALVISITLSLGTLAFESQQAEFNIPHTYMLIERLILSSLLVLLLLFTAFLAYFPVPVNRNTVVHTRVFACYFLVRTVLLIFRNVVTGDAVYIVNAVMQLLATASLISWAMLLSRAGEEVKALTNVRRSAEMEQKLIAQLDAINRTLLSSAKK